MKKTMIGLVAGLALFGVACGVDKEGTADNLIDGLRDSGVEIDDDQEDCVRDLINDYSDDDLEALDDGSASEELLTDFNTRLLECVG